MKKSFAEILASADLMASGIRNRLDDVKSENLGEESAAGIEKLAKKVRSQNAEQEDLKAKLKAKTAELEGTLSELEKSLSDAKKRVKMALPQEEWKAFGIADKR